MKAHDCKMRPDGALGSHCGGWGLDSKRLCLLLEKPARIEIEHELKTRAVGINNISFISFLKLCANNKIKCMI